MSSQQFIVSLRNAVSGVIDRLVRRPPPAQSGRPADTPTLGAFGLLASESDPHRH